MNKAEEQTPQSLSALKWDPLEILKLALKSEPLRWLSGERRWLAA